ncbi:tetratricopeptide repeat protein, partial [bacterium]|nr:tetratricopeptide repeat protein [bacterium]
DFSNFSDDIFLALVRLENAKERKRGEEGYNVEVIGTDGKVYSLDYTTVVNLLGDGKIVIVNGDPVFLNSLGTGLSREIEEKKAVLVAAAKSAVALRQYKKAVKLMKAKRNDEALALFKEAVATRPDYWEAWFNLGYLQKQAGKYVEATKALEKAVKIKPDFIPAWEQLGHSQLKQRDFNGAKEALKRAIALEKENLGDVPKYMDYRPSQVRNYLALTLVLNEQISEALKWIDEAVRIDPDDPEIAHNQASFYALAGKLDHALHLVNQWLKKHPNDQDFHELKVTILEDKENADAIATAGDEKDKDRTGGMMPLLLKQHVKRGMEEYKDKNRLANKAALKAKRTELVREYKSKAWWFEWIPMAIGGLLMVCIQIYRGHLDLSQIADVASYGVQWGMVVFGVGHWLDVQSPEDENNRWTGTALALFGLVLTLIPVYGWALSLVVFTLSHWKTNRIKEEDSLLDRPDDPSPRDIERKARIKNNITREQIDTMFSLFQKGISDIYERYLLKKIAAGEISQVPPEMILDQVNLPKMPTKPEIEKFLEAFNEEKLLIEKNRLAGNPMLFHALQNLIIFTKQLIEKGSQRNIDKIPNNNRFKKMLSIPSEDIEARRNSSLELYRVIAEMNIAEYESLLIEFNEARRLHPAVGRMDPFRLRAILAGILASGYQNSGLRLMGNVEDVDRLLQNLDNFSPYDKAVAKIYAFKATGLDVDFADPDSLEEFRRLWGKEVIEGIEQLEDSKQLYPELPEKPEEVKAKETGKQIDKKEPAGKITGDKADKGRREYYLMKNSGPEYLKKQKEKYLLNEIVNYKSLGPRDPSPADLKELEKNNLQGYPYAWFLEMIEEHFPDFSDDIFLALVRVKNAKEKNWGEKGYNVEVIGTDGKVIALDYMTAVNLVLDEEIVIVNGDPVFLNSSDTGLSEKIKEKKEALVETSKSAVAVIEKYEKNQLKALPVVAEDSTDVRVDWEGAIGSIFAGVFLLPIQNLALLGEGKKPYYYICDKGTFPEDLRSNVVTEFSDLSDGYSVFVMQMDESESLELYSNTQRMRFFSEWMEQSTAVLAGVYDPLTQEQIDASDKFWKIKRIDEEKRKEIKRIHALLKKAEKKKAEMRASMTAVGRRAERAISKNGKTYELEYTSELSMSGFWIELSHFDKNLSSRWYWELSAEEKTQKIMELLRQYPELTEYRECTGENYWNEYYENEAIINQRLQEIRALEGLLFSTVHVGAYTEFDPSSRGYEKQIDTDFLAEELPEDHFFFFLRSTYVDDYNRMEEEKVLDMIKAYRSFYNILDDEFDLIPAIEISEVRRRAIIAYLESLIKESDTLPTALRARFRQIIGTYVYDGGTKLCPYSTYEEWIDITGEQFLDDLYKRSGQKLNAHEKLLAAGDKGVAALARKRLGDKSEVAKLIERLKTRDNGGMMPWLLERYVEQGIENYKNKHLEPTDEAIEKERVRLTHDYQRRAWLLELNPFIAPGGLIGGIILVMGLGLRAGITEPAQLVMLFIQGNMAGLGIGHWFHKKGELTAADRTNRWIGTVLAALSIYFTTIPGIGWIAVGLAGLVFLSSHYLTNRITRVLEDAGKNPIELMSLKDRLGEG